MKALNGVNVVENITSQTHLDPYFPLKALTVDSGLSIRTLRKYLSVPLHPLPHYRLGGKILVRKSEFDRWMQHFRREGSELNQLVTEIIKEAA